MIFKAMGKMIIHIGFEVVPFSKSGGLGDVVGSFPNYISRITKYKNIVITPFTLKIESLVRFYNIYNITFNNLNYEYLVYSSQIDKVEYYFIKPDDVFGFDDGYVDGSKPYLSEMGIEYFFIGKCFVDFIKTLNAKDFCVITHDWHTCGVYPYLDDTSNTLHIIHNYQHQGEMYDDMIAYLEDEIAGLCNSIIYYGCNLSMTALAVFKAKTIVTVSPNYAKEILLGKVAHPNLNYFQMSGKELIGILNGIDIDKWSPNSGLGSFTRYGICNFTECKQKNKAFIKQKYGIKTDSGRLLILMLSRLNIQKGIDLFVDIKNRRPFDEDLQIKELTGMGFDIIVCGVPAGGYSGEIHNKLLKLSACNQNSFKYVHVYSDECAMELLAGCDILLHPSHYEPCGLTPMYAMRFGTVPIVSNVGGLVNVVCDYNNNIEDATGFYIENNSFKDVKVTLGKAKNTFLDSKIWGQLVLNCMSSNFAWDNSIYKYVEIIERGFK
jgi:starch synthase